MRTLHCVFMCPFESGGWRMHACVFIIDPLSSRSHHCDKQEGNDKGFLFPPVLLWGKAGKVGQFFLLPSARIEHRWEEKYQGRRLLVFNLKNPEDYTNKIPETFPENKCHQLKNRVEHLFVVKNIQNTQNVSDIELRRVVRGFTRIYKSTCYAHMKANLFNMFTY